MPRTTTPEAQHVHPGELARYLDANWNGWREGTQETDYILYSPAGSSTVYMIGKHVQDGPGWLDIDGMASYSAAWL